MEPRLRSKRFPPQAGLEPETARSVDQSLTQLSHPGTPLSKGGISENNSFYLHSTLRNIERRKYLIKSSQNVRFRDSVVEPDVLTLAQISPLRNDMIQHQ